MRKNFRIELWLALALMATGPVAAGARQVTDEVGRRVRLPDNIERVVSLAPNLTEIVYALGAGNRLVGVTDYCDFPEAARSKQRVGSVISPSVERIVALKPDLVLATVAGNRAETVTTLEKLGIAVYATNPHSVDDVLTCIQHIGDLLGESQAAMSLVGELRQRLDALDQRLAVNTRGEPPAWATAGPAPPNPSGRATDAASAGSEPRPEPSSSGKSRPRVLFVVWQEPLISAGRGSFLTDAIARAGGQSITANFSSTWPRLSLEKALQEQPDFLIFTFHGSAAEKATQLSALLVRLKHKPGWRKFRAVREGKVILVSDAINRPSPRLIDAIEELARALHPEVFSWQPRP